jgi:hypothetical protein
MKLESVYKRSDRRGRVFRGTGLIFIAKILYPDAASVATEHILFGSQFLSLNFLTTARKL